MRIKDQTFSYPLKVTEIQQRQGTVPEVCLLGLYCPDRETLFKIALKKFSVTCFSGYIIAHYLWHFNHF